jgi:NAD(P)H-flavin reductase
MSARRETLTVAGIDRVGPYSLLRVARGGIDPGDPGQLFMLRADPMLLPRPMSLCAAPSGELGFLIDVIGPGTTRLTSLARGDSLSVFGPLGHGFPRDAREPLLVGGGIGIAPLPYLSERLGNPPALLGFRSDEHAVAAGLVPNAEVVVEPVRVTEPLARKLQRAPSITPLACGPAPMLEAVAAIAPDAWLAHEAPMACGYGACFGCAVEIDGVLKRLCVEGPTLRADRLWPGERVLAEVAA